MCGISGIIGAYEREQLHSMVAAMTHRGPDASQTFFDDSVALGHNRLSIIDLSEVSNQPFLSNDENFVLVFNGEIYNYLELREQLKDQYSFRTKSDTEVLLAAYIIWGEECLHKLNGMFSFAIWDRRKKSLFAARDRFGVKPFYYVQSNGGFYFASEIKALFAARIKKEHNKKVWSNYFNYGSYGAPNETFWNGINQLPGGHCLSISNNKTEIKRWYIFEEEIKKYQDRNFTEETAKAEYLRLLEDSIALRFRSDVPVGFNISGGLDSSVLLANVNQREDVEKIQAYTFFTNNEAYDELPWVKKMIASTQTNLNEVLFTTDEFEHYQNVITKAQDEPYGGIPTLAYAKLFEQARKDGVIVLLDGQGMDEQWAGYDYYAHKTESVIQGVKKSPFRSEVLSDELKSSGGRPPYPKIFEDDLLNLQYRDLFYTKLPRALRFNDRISMAFSTELREPFLDYRLVELAFSLPKDYKIQQGSGKYLLRNIASEIVPDNVVYAPKRPLQTPQREWLGNELKGIIDEAIDKIENSVYKPWFQMDAMKKEWKAYLDGAQDSSFHLWQWYNFSTLID